MSRKSILIWLIVGRFILATALAFFPYMFVWASGGKFNTEWYVDYLLGFNIVSQYIMGIVHVKGMVKELFTGVDFERISRFFKDKEYSVRWYQFKHRVIWNIKQVPSRLRQWFIQLIHDENLSKVRWSIHTYYEHVYKVPNTASMIQFHKIDVKTYKSKIKITIWMSRPGIFVGMKGKDIDALQQYLEHLFNKKIEFKIQEHDPFVTSYHRLNTI